MRAARIHDAPSTVWATLGLGFLLLQLWVYGSWIAAGEARPLSPTGPDRLPGDVRLGMVAIEGLLGALTVLVAVALLVDCWRRRGLSIGALLGIGFLSQVWLDQSVSYVRPGLLYNSYLVNVASWAPHLPGQIGPSGRSVEPLLLFGPCDLAFILPPLLIGTLLERVRRRRPRMGWLPLFLVAWVAGTALNLGLEPLFIHFQMYCYPATIPSLTELAGTPFQYPVYSAVSAGALYVAAPALLVGFRDDLGRTIIERGVDARAPARLRMPLRALAFVAFLNVMAIASVAVLVVGTLLSGPTPAEIPSYLRNGML
jgi:Spirocyclase AveC-like